MTVRMNDVAALVSTTSAGSTVFTHASPPSKTVVGLSNVNNWGASSSTSSSSTTTYATTAGVKSAYDLAASKITQSQADVRYINNGASNASLSHLNCHGTGNDYNTAAVELIGNGSSNTVFPTLGFHQPGVFASSLQLRAGGDFRFYRQGATAYASIVAGSAIFDNGASTAVVVKCDDQGEAVVNIMGDSQGTGRLYVGQSSLHGGGIEYNGDGTPVGAGGGTDYIALYRRDAGTMHWTARNSYSNNNWEFRGHVTSPQFNGSLNGNASTATRSTQCNVNTSASTGFFGVVWASGNTIYQSSNQGFTVRPSDGFVKIKHAYFCGDRINAQADGCIVAHNDGVRYAGMYGLYNPAKISHIWSMGTAYKVHSAGSNFGNLYGLAYKHTNNATGGTMAGGHQMVWCTNGTPRAAMGDSGIWTSGRLTANNIAVTTVAATTVNTSAVNFTSHSNDSAGIRTTLSGTSTHLDFTLRDDFNGNDQFRWLFQCSGDSERVQMSLYPTATGANKARLTVHGTVLASDDITAFSDRRIKTDITLITQALKKLYRVRGVTFGRTDDDDKTKRHTGVIAQELEAVLPEAVTTIKNEELNIDDFKTVNYGATIGLLIEAIKELNDKVDAHIAAH